MALLLGAIGCQATPIIAPAAISPEASRRYVIHLPGMAGWIKADSNLVQGLADANVAGHYEIYDWTGPHWMIGAVWAYEDNRAQARHIADRIAAKLRQQPDAQIVLTGWSAGCAVAIWALEDLPDGVMVQSVLLVQPAVDPDHDLTHALRHVRRHLFATQSGGDSIMLGIGTLIFGTTDGGAHVIAAGNSGFHKPPAGDVAEYRKLVEIPYQSEWSKYHDFGGHAGPTEREFAKEVLGPMVINDAERRR
jgi:pimeloyl-ACP methyl ester carboxylesterase